MSAFFSIRADIKAVTRDLTRLERKEVPAATIQALNSTGRKTETKAIAGTAQGADVQKSRVRWYYSPDGTRSKRRRVSRSPAKKGKPITVIRAALTPIPAITLGNARETRRGVRVGRRVYPGAFIARKKTGGRRQIRERVAAPRYPIEVQIVETEAHTLAAFGAAVNASGPLFVREIKANLDRRFRRKGLNKGRIF